MIAHYINVDVSDITSKRGNNLGNVRSDLPEALLHPMCKFRDIMRDHACMVGNLV